MSTTTAMRTTERSRILMQFSVILDIVYNRNVEITSLTIVGHVQLNEERHRKKIYKIIFIYNGFLIKYV